MTTRRVLIVLVLALVTIPVAIAIAAPPTVTTNAASSISTTSATLNSSVDPNGASATVHYEYGPTALYGTSSNTLGIGSGTSAVSAPILVTGLTPGVTYHFKAVAVNADGTISGADRTFVAGVAPGVSTSSATSITRSSATLRARVDPNGLETTYRFQYGTTSSSLNLATPVTSAGSGTSAKTVSAAIAGLAPNDRIYYRVTATNAAGTRTGSTRSFVTSKALTIDSIGIPSSRFGGIAKITGDLDGSGASNVLVAIQGTAHPYTAGFTTLATARSNSRGNFSVTVSKITANMHIRVIAAGSSSAVRNLFNRPRVGVILRKRTRLLFSGTVLPQAASGLLRIQKRTPRGNWKIVRRGKLKPFTLGRSRYALSARRTKGLYRVQVLPRDGGAHAAGYSRLVRVR